MVEPMAKIAMAAASGKYLRSRFMRNVTKCWVHLIMAREFRNKNDRVGYSSARDRLHGVP